MNELVATTTNPLILLGCHLCAGLTLRITGEEQIQEVLAPREFPGYQNESPEKMFKAQTSVTGVVVV